MSFRDPTAAELAVLNDVVIDGAAWYAHAKANHPGPVNALMEKVANHSAAYAARLNAGNYKTRAERKAG